MASSASQGPMNRNTHCIGILVCCLKASVWSISLHLLEAHYFGGCFGDMFISFLISSLVFNIQFLE